MRGVGFGHMGSTARSVGGSADLSWTAPTTNSVGDTFDNSTPDRTLAGYRVYYDTISPPVAFYSETGWTSITLTGLASGTWYLAVTALDGDGDESALSEVVERTVT